MFTFFFELTTLQFTCVKHKQEKRER